MDQDTLVEGGGKGLARIADAFRARGLPVSGIYLIRLTSEEGYAEWVIRLLSDSKMPGLTRQMIDKLVQLRRENALPEVSPGVRFDMISSDHVEAARVIDYARQIGKLPVTIRDTMWKGLFIEYALVAQLPQATFAVA